MSNQTQGVPLVCNGTIYPLTFVFLDSSRDFALLQASGTAIPIFGVAQQGPKIAPNLQQALFPGSTPTLQPAGYKEDSIQIFLPGEICLLTAGTAGWSPRDYLTADINGYGVAATTGQFYGAIALSAANSGDLGQVFVFIGTK